MKSSHTGAYDILPSHVSVTVTEPIFLPSTNTSYSPCFTLTGNTTVPVASVFPFVISLSSCFKTTSLSSAIGLLLSLIVNVKLSHVGGVGRVIVSVQVSVTFTFLSSTFLPFT